MIYCCRCKRQIIKSAVQATIGGAHQQSYGPVCAMRLGLLAVKPKRRKANRKKRTNSNQLTLIA